MYSFVFALEKELSPHITKHGNLKLYFKGKQMKERGESQFIF